MICKHPQFKAETTIANHEDGTFSVSLAVHCAECFKPLVFVGMPAGIHFEKPTVSIDGMEVRLNARLLS